MMNTVRELLFNTNAILKYEDKWLYYDNGVWVVMQKKYRRSAQCVLRTVYEMDAVRKLQEIDT